MIEDDECDCPACRYQETREELAARLIKEIIEEESEEGPLPDTCFDACSQCQIVTINGVSCHEVGCPNSLINPVTQKGYPVKCWECGCDYIPEEKAGKYSMCPDCIEDATNQIWNAGEDNYV